MNPSRALVLAAAGLAALALGVWAGFHQGAPPALGTQVAVVLPAPRPVADFALADQDGAAFTPARLKGHWTLLFAGYTHCPDVCPTTLGILKAVEKRLPPGSTPGVAPLQMVFVSVDPGRDTPEQLRRYVRYFSPTLLGVTGPADQLDKLCASLGLAYMIVPGASATDYSVDHSAALALIDPEARVSAYFQPPHQADTLAADLVRILQPRA